MPEWRDIAVELRDGQPPGRMPFFRTVEEKLEHVAAGHGIVVLPLSTATFYTRADISHVLVCDIAPNQVCLAWDSLRRSPLIRDYAAIARTTCSAATAHRSPSRHSAGGCGGTGSGTRPRGRRRRRRRG